MAKREPFAYVIRRVGGNGSTHFWEYASDVQKGTWTTATNTSSKFLNDPGGANRAVWMPCYKSAAKGHARALGGQLVGLVRKRPEPVSLPPEQFDALLGQDDNDMTLCQSCGEMNVEEEYEHLSTCAECVAKDQDPLECGRYALTLDSKRRQAIEWDCLVDSLCEDLEQTRKDRDSATMRVVKLLEENDRLRAR